MAGVTVTPPSPLLRDLPPLRMGVGRGATAPSPLQQPATATNSAEEIAAISDLSVSQLVARFPLPPTTPVIVSPDSACRCHRARQTRGRPPR